MKKWFLILLAVLAVLFVIWCLLLGCRRDHKSWDTLLQYRYAHRGYHDKPTIPENSMAAFRRAIEHGYGAELDVHLMKDGNLAVIHDSSLLRTAGADVRIEDLTREDLARYCLEDSSEQIPLLEDVLALFENETPLIVELKPENGNYSELCAAVAAMLDGYRGDYCIESFDPRVVHWFKQNRPEVCRGQLSCDFMGNEKSPLPGPLKFAMTNLLTNFLTQPDFVAYKFADRDNLSLRLCKAVWNPQIFLWTITGQESMNLAEAENAACIFEGFEPQES